MGLKQLLTRSPRAPSSPSVPEDTAIFAIGDVHGRADLLGLVLGWVKAGLKGRADAKTVLVGLGDYIDRGPRSRDVIELLLAMTKLEGLECQFLKGNHEEVLLTFLLDAKAGPAWCDFGGREMLDSYGVQAPLDPFDAEAWEQTRVAFEEALPPEHRSFFEGLKTSYVAGDYIFVHAGLRPGVPLEEQRENDLLWIRKPFLSSRQGFSKVVVHGHTPEEEAHVDRRRIGLDTGAYATSILSVLRLEGRDRFLVQTFPSDEGRFDLRGLSV